MAAYILYHALSKTGKFRDDITEEMRENARYAIECGFIVD